MRVLHIAPGDSAGGSLKQAIRQAGRDDEVLPFRDDLSCGPIDSDDPSARAAWWAQFYEWFEVEEPLRTFWRRVLETQDRLVVWVGRRSARELAFFLAWVDRLGERAYEVVDVTGRQFSFKRRDGTKAVIQSAQSVSPIPAEALKSLLDSGRSLTTEEQGEYRRRWRRLREENAPFRIVADAELGSAPIDYFDPWILEQATTEWQRLIRIVANGIAYSERYLQVGELMLLTRVVALVEQGKLAADGDPWDMRCCRIRLPH